MKRKRVLAILLSMAIVCSLGACGKGTANNESSENNSASVGTETESEQPGLDESSDFEKPISENTAVYYNKKTSSYDAQAEKVREAIVNSESEVVANGETRYVSYRGNDDNDGKTPETAWQTIDRLVGEEVDTILFERGGVYRGSLRLESDTAYGAYGEGYKPTFYTGDKNYADPDLWKQTSKENIWAVKVGSKSDIGNLIFDHGKKIGMKKIQTYRNLEEDYDFYHHSDNGVLYVYSTEGNPGERFESIEIAYGHGMRAPTKNSKNITIDNLCVKYAGMHGISFGAGVDNVKISNCEIGWIGGSMSDYGRLGNGIEFINSYSNTVVENCWIYQCYDAGYTFQNTGERSTEENMTFQDSLVEYCNYNIEIFGPEDGVVKNILFDNNILRFGGFGWGSINRIGSNDSAASNMSLFKGIKYTRATCENYVISNNVFDTALRRLVDCAYPNDPNGYGPTITGNTYIQQPSETAYATLTQGSTTELDTVEYGCKTQAEFEASIRAFDTNPKLVKLEDN